jgi:hypothetical protein
VNTVEAINEKLAVSEAALILQRFSDQTELFPEVDESELTKVLFLLNQYPLMRLRIQDYEEHEHDLELTAIEGEVARRISSDEYYANKTANTFILKQKRQWVYNEYKWMTAQIERSHRLIIDRDFQKAEEERKAVRHRYLEGHAMKDVFSFFPRSGLSKRTIERRLHCGIIKIANNMKLNGILEREWKN